MFKSILHVLKGNSSISTIILPICFLPAMALAEPKIGTSDCLRQLAEEQEGIQTGVTGDYDKIFYRKLFDYAESVFAIPDSVDHHPNSAQISNFFSNGFPKQFSEQESYGFDQLFQKIRGANKQTVIWADASGGLAVALRQLRQFTKLGDGIRMINIDAVDWASKYKPDDTFVDSVNQYDDYYASKQSKLEKLERFVRMVLNTQFKTSDNFERLAPEFIQADITSVRLTEKVDLFTNIQAMMYYRDKIAALVNMYNQLAPNGFLVISMGGRSWFHNHFLVSFIQSLAEQGVPVASNVGKNFGDIAKRSINLETIIIQKTVPKIASQNIELVGSIRQVSGFVHTIYQTRNPKKPLATIVPLK